MCRVEQQQAVRGSQKWLQILINQHPALIDAALRRAIKSLPPEDIEWLSPLKTDVFAEYRDECFIERLGTTLTKRPLKDFWPAHGPVWDGLGRIGQEALFLIEAKSHIAEIASGPTKASAEASVKRIHDSLQETKKFLGSSVPADWSQIFYQYTNRLAHLYLLREVNNRPAYLINVHFVNDTDMNGPSSCAEWEGALKLLKVYLGVPHHRLDPYVIDLYFDLILLKF